MNGEETAVTITEEPRELSIPELKNQAELIKNAIKAVMIENHHYGKIPGCGDKPTLLKPGAEKLCLLFRLAPKYEIIGHESAGGHREYESICNLIHIPTGRFVGQGVGVCSTLESKYRYRTGPTESTGKPVPTSYWDLRKSDNKKAQELLGGRGYVTKKIEGRWEICKQGEKVENQNPADEWNTVKKMSKKRALVDAVLTATAASDSFTQDLEDLRSNNQASQPAKTQPEPSGEASQASNEDNPLVSAKKLFTKVFKQLSDVDPEKYNKDWEKQYNKTTFNVNSIWKCKTNQLEKMRVEYKQLLEFVEVCQEEASTGGESTQ